MGARRPRRKSKPAPRDAATHRSDGGSLPFSPRCVSILYRSREARGFWPADRPATCRRQQGANASPETGTIRLEAEQSRRRVPRRTAGFSFSGAGGRGPGTSRREVRMASRVISSNGRPSGSSPPDGGETGSPHRVAQDSDSAPQRRSCPLCAEYSRHTPHRMA
jgi:hypothetical protein